MRSAIWDRGLAVPVLQLVAIRIGDLQLGSIPLWTGQRPIPPKRLLWDNRSAQPDRRCRSLYFCIFIYKESAGFVTMKIY